MSIIKIEPIRFQLTFPQASKIVAVCHFLKEDGSKDKVKNRLLFHLLTSDVNKKIKTKETNRYFSLEFLVEGTSFPQKLFWVKNTDSKELRALLQSFITAPRKNSKVAFKWFKLQAPGFLGDFVWTDLFPEDFDASTSRTQFKGKLYIKRINGEFRINFGQTTIGIVTQMVAEHIWENPETYVGLSPVSTKELRQIYSKLKK